MNTASSSNLQFYLRLNNKQLIEHIIQHINYETLIHEQTFCFEIILQILRRPIKKSKALTTIDIMILTLKQV